jgi:hypothetical protein
MAGLSPFTTGTVALGAKSLRELCDVLSSFSSQGKATLHELCRVMGLLGKPDGISGGEVEKYYRDDHTREIACYCESDVLNTYRVWLRYELFRGRLSEAQFQASEADLVDFIRARGIRSRTLLILCSAHDGQCSGISRVKPRVGTQSAIFVGGVEDWASGRAPRCIVAASPHSESKERYVPGCSLTSVYRSCFHRHRIKSRADALANRSLPDTVAPRKRDAAFSATEREPHTSTLLVRSDGGFFMPADNVIRFLPAEEEAILARYLTGSHERRARRCVPFSMQLLQCRRGAGDSRPRGMDCARSCSIPQ